MKFARNVWLALLLALLPVTPPAFAFGTEATRIIAAVAQAHLSEGSKDVLTSLFGRPPTLANFADWDEKNAAQQPWLRPRLFVRIPMKEAFPIRPSLSDSGDLVSAVEDQIKVLRSFSATTPQRQDAVRWLVCLMADLHQPFHVTDNGDNFGRDTRLLYQGRAVSLFNLWETEMISFHYPSPERLMQEIVGLVSYHESEYEKVTIGTPWSWARETSERADTSYLVDGKPMSQEMLNGIPKTYAAQSLRMYKAQIKLAALRLAYLLNTAFEGQPQFEGFRYFWDKSDRQYHAAGCTFFQSVSPENLILSDLKPLDRTPHPACRPR